MRSCYVNPTLVSDNYEWLESYRPEAKFGLFYVDHTIIDFNRKITEGAQTLKFIIAESISQSKLA